MLDNPKNGSEHDEGDIDLTSACAEVDERQFQSAAAREDPNNPLHWPLWVKVR